MRDKILDKFPDESFLFADELDEAVIGVYNNKVVYSMRKCIDIMSDIMESEQDAIEYLEYNTFNAYVGDQTPIFVDDLY